MLGALLFLLHINDLLSVVNYSAIRLFADDCLIYRPIRSREDQDILQGDLDSVERWSDIFGMKFNPSKCNIMSIARSRSLFTLFYSLCGQVLSSLPKARYLGYLLLVVDGRSSLNFNCPILCISDS